jgi:hypothetical protein
MLLRNSISNTKKFFRKTLQSFKSLFSGDYQRLPKSPPKNPFSYTHSVDMNIVQPTTDHNELDKFYTEFTNKWDSDKDGAKKGSKKQETEVYSGSFMEFSQTYPTKKNHNHHEEIMKRREDHSCSKGRTRTRGGKANWLVVQKLKELEMLDVSNVDHLLDIEEVLHYYSRLTCPAYLDIVDKFFMDMCAEFFGAGTLTPARSMISTSRLRPRSVRS